MRRKNPGKEVEKQVLKKIKARPQPNSGSTPGMPNDGVKGRYLIEVKSTEKKSIRLQLEDLAKLEDNALMHGKIPALVIAFEGRQWWVATPIFDFEKITLGWRTR